MSASWLHYWKAPQIRRGLARGRLAHIASEQFYRVRPGDRIWIVNVADSGNLLTIGFVDATEPISRSDARQLVDYEPWDATYHIIVSPQAAQRARTVDLSPIASELRFHSRSSARLKIREGRVNGQQLQSMRLLSPASAALIQDLWGLDAELRDDEYQRILHDLEQLGDLDAKREVIVRREQGFLRDYLFGLEKVGTCAICGSEYPVSLLVAAHVKRRADCSEPEKRDYENNVAPMCSLGCDALFERGFLVVVEGHIKPGPFDARTPEVRRRIKQLNGRRCEIWHAGSASYFEAHLERARSRAAT